MKTIVSIIALLFALVALAAVNGMPYGNEPEYAMVPDENGWKLVNINEDPEPDSFYNPETDIIFTLFTRDGPEDGEVIQWNNPSSVRSSTFNPAHPTKITIHGWGGGARDAINIWVRRNLFTLGEYNCITMDWNAGAGTNNYLAARNRVGPTGTVGGNLLRMISAETGASYESMSAIGFSLGGHVAGFIGKTLAGRMGSIVALDAALPLFSINNPEGRVDTADALYVESLHTNGGLLGFDVPLGHASFYPNGGRSQPGCGTDLGGGCAHGRANNFYAESLITDVGFWARQCRNYDDILSNNCVSSGPDVKMGGEPLSTTSNGVYWLATAEASPFALGRM